MHQWLCDNNKIDGKQEVILLDGHASHITLGAIKVPTASNLVIFQLLSHASHLTQPLDVCTFRGGSEHTGAGCR